MTEKEYQEKFPLRPLTDEELQKAIETMHNIWSESLRRASQAWAEQVDREIMESDIPPAFREAFKED